MRVTAIPLTVGSLLLVGLLSPSMAQPTAPAQIAPKGDDPCAQIAVACKQAGFAPGSGLGSECIRPIMAATPQQKQATKPLPQIDPQVVAACKQLNPNFGRGAGGGQPATKPSGT
jgi:hypothetical protein